MSEFMTAARLRQIVDLSDQPDLLLRPAVPVMRWIIEEETGRPISYWVLAEKQPVGIRSPTAEDAA